MGEKMIGMSRRQTGVRSPGRGVVRVRGLAVILATVTIGMLAAREEARAEHPGAIIAEFSGTSDLTTTPFAATGSWYLQWSSPGRGQAYILVETPDGGRLDGVSGNSGNKLEPFPGPIRLTVSSPNPWTIRVLRADP